MSVKTANGSGPNVAIPGNRTTTSCGASFGVVLMSASTCHITPLNANAVSTSEPASSTSAQATVIWL